MQQLVQTRPRLLLFIIFFLALTFRLGTLKMFYDHVGRPHGTLVYIDTAEHVLTGKGFVYDNRLFLFYLKEYLPQHSNQWADIDQIKQALTPAPEMTERFYWRPGYIIFLSSLIKLTGSNKIIYPRIFQILFDASVCFLLFGIARRLWNPQVGLLAALIFAFWFPNAYTAVMIIHDAILPATMGWALYCCVRAIEENSWRWTIIGGIVIGLGVNIRETLFLLIPLFLLGCTLKHSRTVALFRTAVMGLLVGLCMIPWMWHNHRVIGKARFLMPHTGIGLIDGIVDADKENRWKLKAGDNYLISIARSEDPSVSYTPHSHAFDKLVLRKALKIIKEDPIWYLNSIAKRLAQLLLNPFSPWQFFSPEPYWSVFKSQGGTFLGYARLYPVTFFWRVTSKLLEVLLLGLAFVGFCFSFNKWKGTLILGLIPILGIGLHSTMRAAPTYILPLQIPYFLFAASLFFRDKNTAGAES